MLIDVGMCPAAYSSGLRTSMTTSFGFVNRLLNWWGPTMLCQCSTGTSPPARHSAHAWQTGVDAARVRSVQSAAVIILLGDIIVILSRQPVLDDIPRRGRLVIVAVVNR